jgi:hypothetical protein
LRSPSLSTCRPSATARSAAVTILDRHLLGYARAVRNRRSADCRLPEDRDRLTLARRLSRPRRADRRGDGAGHSSPPGQPLKRARKALRSCKRRRDRRRNRKTNPPVTASQPTAIIATPMIWLWSGIGRASISGISQRKSCRPGSPAAKRADLIVGCP